MKAIRIEQTESTNSYVKEHRDEIGLMRMVVARRQTAGRGQRGNSWESEPGKNITFSFLYKPDIPPAMQFAVSEAAALAIVAFLEDYGIAASVKWPNDIYVENKKICGILIENSIMGSRIEWSVIGAGINVNQKDFFSDAPNPISMTQITGIEYNLEELIENLGARVEEYMAKTGYLHSEYMERLWRSDGRKYPFRDSATGETFQAAIVGVSPTGHLALSNGKSYAFKEVVFL